MGVIVVLCIILMFVLLFPPSNAYIFMVVSFGIFATIVALIVLMLRMIDAEFNISKSNAETKRNIYIRSQRYMLSEKTVNYSSSLVVDVDIPFSLIVDRMGRILNEIKEGFQHRELADSGNDGLGTKIVEFFIKGYPLTIIITNSKIYTPERNYNVIVVNIVVPLDKEDRMRADIERFKEKVREELLSIYQSFLEHEAKFQATNS